jgi:hypothetical protein
VSRTSRRNRGCMQSLRPQAARKFVNGIFVAAAGTPTATVRNTEMSIALSGARRNCNQSYRPLTSVVVVARPTGAGMSNARRTANAGTLA